MNQFSLFPKFNQARLITKFSIRILNDFHNKAKGKHFNNE